MTIRTVTLSPGFDHDVHIDHLDESAIGTVSSWVTYAGGKGLNVARIASWLGADAVAYSLIGKDEEASFNTLAERAGHALVTVPVEQSTRQNLTLRIGANRSKSSHATGRKFEDVPKEPLVRLFDRLVEDTVPDDIVTFNGSLPDRSPFDVWVGLAHRVKVKGASIVADVQGQAMLNLLMTGLVFAAKPNEMEAHVLLPPAFEGGLLAGAVVALSAMQERRVLDPLVTLGSLGVIHLVEGLPHRSACPAQNPVVEVGAGDAFVAGYCSALEGPRRADASPVAVGLAVASAHVDGHKGELLAINAAARVDQVQTMRIEGPVSEMS